MNHDSSSEKRPCIPDGGFVIVFCLFILAILSISSVFALKMSMTEHGIVRNHRVQLSETYLAEAGLAQAFQQSSVWLISDLLIEPDRLGVCFDLDVEDARREILGTVRVDARSIVDSTDPLLNWVDRAGEPVQYPGAHANDVPALPHTRKVKGGGDSAAALVQRNYSVTVTSPGGNTRIQAGGYKLFPATDG